MTKPVILTGLRANNNLHIGNYFGALLPLIDMAKTHADDYEINLFVPDLHSFTTPIDHSQLQAQILYNLKLFAAAGLPLDNPNVHIYRQSYVPAHSELTWILDCFTGYGEMGRMTQFKDKSRGNDPLTRLKAFFKEQKDIDTDSDPIQDVKKIQDFETLGKAYIKLYEKYNREYNRINNFVELLFEDVKNNDSTTVGLFNYPVLMAADILLYGASYVPVGDDQSQHLEFTRDIAERMNNRFRETYGELFIVPKAVKQQHEFFGKEQGLRIKDLQDPTKKMSKSDESGRGIIFLSDSPEEAAKKIRGATTDSLGKIDSTNPEQAGVRNLLQVLALARGGALSDVAAEFDGQEQYGPLKSAVADAVQSFLTNFQAQLSQVDEPALLAKLEADEAAINQIANAKLYQVQQAVGLRAAS